MNFRMRWRVKCLAGLLLLFWNIYWHFNHLTCVSAILWCFALYLCLNVLFFIVGLGFDSELLGHLPNFSYICTVLMFTFHILFMRYILHFCQLFNFHLLPIFILNFFRKITITFIRNSIKESAPYWRFKIFAQLSFDSTPINSINLLSRFRYCSCLMSWWMQVLFCLRAEVSLSFLCW